MGPGPGSASPARRRLASATRSCAASALYAPEHSLVVNVPDIGWFRDRLRAGAGVEARVVNWLLAEHPWDMAFVTFGEPHGAGHYLWHVGDATYPSHPAGAVAGLGHPLRDVYEAVDRAIGDITRADRRRGDRDRDLRGWHGAELRRQPPAPGRAEPARPVLLGERGRWRRRGRSAEAGPVGHRSQRHPAWRSAVGDPLPATQRPAQAEPEVGERRDRLAAVPRSCIPNANEGYLRVNLRGREPLGIVNSGTGCQQLLADLAAAMRGLRNPADGRATVDQVFLIDEVFPGSERRHLPDLVVAWDPDARLLTEMATPSAGTVVGPAAYRPRRSTPATTARMPSFWRVALALLRTGNSNRDISSIWPRPSSRSLGSIRLPISREALGRGSAERMW